MAYKNKKIGIWGFGVVGQSAARYFLDQEVQLSVMEKRPFSDQELAWFKQNGIIPYGQNAIDQFFLINDYILASPGIDTCPYPQLQEKLICELDIFAQEWKKPIIAITGTVGKTSTTHFVAQALAQTERVATGGNIGFGMLDLIEQEEKFDCAVLELSSFQLEHLTTQISQAALIIWTNLYPNHLDRHGSMNGYLNAKLNLLTHSNQKILLNAQLLKYEIVNNFISNFPERVSLYSDEPIITEVNSTIRRYYTENGNVIKEYQGRKNVLRSALEIPSISYAQNWIAVIASLDILNIPQINLIDLPLDSSILSHRFNKIETKDGIIFYDDSKGTVPEATLSAVAQFKDQPLILILGGVSKGVDRSEFIKKLPSSIKHVICFGSEAEMLHTWCISRGLAASHLPTLDDVIAKCKQIALPGIPILFSPSGASYDLFTDYKARGKRFCELIKYHYL